MLIWSAVLLAMTLIGGAWALASPIGGTPDERANIYHAAGSAGAGFFPTPAAAKYGTGAFFDVPQELVRPCVVGGIADFCTGLADPGKMVRTASYVGRYNSLYYVVVGWPLRLWPGPAGLLFARLISALLVAATLTAALYCAFRWSRHRVVVPALIVAATPMLFHLSGAVNPNALEIAAGILLFSALIPLGDASVPPPTASIRLAGIAGILLTTLRGLGPLWVAVAVAVVLPAGGWDRLRELFHSRPLRRWTAVVAVSGIGGVAWTIAFQADVGAQTVNQHLSALFAVKQMLLVNWGALVLQMVGDLGYLSTPLPMLVVYAWVAVAGFLLLGAVVFATRSARLRLFSLVVACLAIPTVLTVINVNTLSFFWQGRYILPLAVGVPIMAAHELAAADVLNDQVVRRLTRILAVLLLPAQLLALAIMMIRWQNNMVKVDGAMPLNPLHSTGWHPAYGSLAPIVAMAGGVILLGAAYLTMVRPAQPEEIAA